MALSNLFTRFMRSPAPESEKAVEDSASSVTLALKPLSTSSLVFIHAMLAMTLFLATTDTHIVSTALPTISAELQGSSTLYSWVGVAYTLTQTAFQPLYAVLGDMFGRKPVLHTSIFIFLLGSALCGAAQSMMWLVLARGLAGIGGGGIVSMVWIVMAEIVSDAERAKWSEALSVTWAASAVAGPLLGGVFSEKASWRWGFYLNLPVCGVCMVLLFWLLRDIPLLGPNPNQSWKSKIEKFDFIGLLLLMLGTTTLLLGFNSAAEVGWQKPKTIALLSCGVAGLIIAGAQEILTKQNPLIPPILLRDLSCAIVLFASFFQTFSFTAGTFYLALYYQAVTGASAVKAGIMMFPYALGSALISIAAAQYISITQKYKHVVLAGLGTATLGFGLMIMMDHHSGLPIQIIFPLIAGLGMGLLFRSPFTALETSAPKEVRAGLTATFFLVRFIGTCTGLAVAGAMFDSRVRAVLPSEFNLDFSKIDWRSLVHISSPELREQVLAGVSNAISLIWIFCTPCLGVSFFLTFLIKQRPIVRDAEDEAQKKDLEKGDLDTTISQEPNMEKLQSDKDSIQTPSAESNPSSTTSSTVSLPLSLPEEKSVKVPDNAEALEPVGHPTVFADQSQTSLSSVSTVSRSH
ncbi:hypothetical protein FRC03_002026 [Tulasnella sp. 419]|nr:hypothetical protein FRC03_002026 [Tulasnella sp. 419]